jgi:hypothetical protein
MSKRRLIDSMDDAANYRKRKIEMSDGERSEASSAGTASSDSDSEGSPDTPFLEIKKLKAMIYDRDQELNRIRKRRAACEKEKRRLEQVCQKEESTMPSTCISPNDTEIRNSELSKFADIIAALKVENAAVLRQLEIILSDHSAERTQLAAQIETERAATVAQEELREIVVHEKAAVVIELANVREVLAAVLREKQRVEGKFERFQRDHGVTVQAALAAVTRLKKKLADEKALIDKHQHAQNGAMRETAKECALTVAATSHTCAEAEPLNGAELTLAADSSSSDSILTPSEVAILRAQIAERDEQLLERDGVIAELRHEIAVSTATAAEVLREHSARAEYNLAGLRQEKTAMILKLAATQEESIRLTNRCTEIVRQNCKDQQTLMHNLEVERVGYMAQLDAALQRVAELQWQVRERDERISRLIDKISLIKPGVCATGCSTEVMQWDIPPAYSAQLADLQAQVWELRSTLNDRIARVAELEQQCCLGTTERTLYERLRLTLADKEGVLKRLQHHQEGCASVVSAAVAALRREYPDVFLRCTEIARQRYPRAEGAAADYYTLGVYGYRASPAAPGDRQDQHSVQGSSGRKFVSFVHSVADCASAETVGEAAVVDLTEEDEGGGSAEAVSPTESGDPVCFSGLS